MKGIHLALDATDGISFALPPAAKLGYDGIYFVGPETLVARLDVPD